MIAILALLPVLDAAAASNLTRAKRAVIREVNFEFPAGAVSVRCSRISQRGYKCRWRTLMDDPAYHDYHGQARATVNRYGADAVLLRGVHCHFCIDGAVPRRLR